MGNTESTAVKFCSANNQLYTTRGHANSLKEQMNSRTVWPTVTPVQHKLPMQATQIKPIRKQRPVQQLSQCRQQQLQEDIVEFTLEKQEPVEIKRESFNVYVSCLEDQLAEKELPTLEEADLSEEIEAHIKDTMKVFEGLFGNVIVHENGLVLYTDISGKKYCEDFEAEGLRKTFPMGISYGELTKSIWFEDAVERDNCFDQMVKKVAEPEDAPPSYQEVAQNPTKYRIEPLEINLTDEDNIKVFEGIRGKSVIVHAENLVLYTDINDKKHCVSYNPREICKSFPSGVSGGGLPKSIWFADEQERDLCYALMQWNMDQEIEQIEETPERFEGLYGAITLNKSGEVEFTSLTGEKVTSYYEPSEIQGTFPLGISYGRLPKTIWFEDIEQREACLQMMREIDG